MTKHMPEPNLNPTLLDLLRMGARVEFENECVLVGHPDTLYIEPRYMGESLGLWHLSPDGLRNALQDLKSSMEPEPSESEDSE